MRPLLIAFVSVVVGMLGGAEQANPFLGAWNLTGTGEHAGYVYWVEIKADEDRLSGMFLNRTSSPFALSSVTVTGNELVFVQAGGRGRPDVVYKARLENGRLVGEHQLPPDASAGAGAGPRVVRWIGTRPPVWPAANANGAHTYGTPVALFDGASLDAWTVQHKDRPMNWTVDAGLLTNGAMANNLVSKQTFGDFKVEAEYKLGQKSNSGIYLRGRYELQLFDDAADTTTRRDLGHMAIYGRTPPLVKASRPADEWQQMTATLVANRLTVTLNGQQVHDNAAVLGVTGGALDNDELAPGPIVIQGDHTRVWIRRLIVTPISRAAR